MKHLYFVLNYKSADEHEFVARYIELAENTNLICLFKDFGKVEDNEIGETAYLDTICQCRTKKQALWTCEQWNKTYKSEDRLFRGN